MTRNTILSVHLNLFPGNISDWVSPDELLASTEAIAELFADEFAEARRGLPQGSAVSPLVTELLLAPVLSQLPKCGIAIGYSDNILIMARKKDDAVSMTTSLRSALKAHPAGPFWLKKPFVYPPGSEVKFLGYRLKAEAGKCSAAPSGKNLFVFEHEFAKGLDRITRLAISPTITHRRLANLAHYVRSWSGAFSHWEGASDHRQKYLQKIDAVAAAIDIPETEV